MREIAVASFTLAWRLAAGGDFDLPRGVADLVGEVHRLESEHLAVDANSSKVLPAPHDEGGDPDLSRLAHRLDEERVRPSRRLSLRRDEIGLVVEDRVDVDLVDEVLDLDCPRPRGLDGLELARREHDVAPVADVVALHDVVVLDFLAGVLVHPLVPDAVGGALLQLVEADRLLRHGGVEADGNVDQAETDRPRPDRSSHLLLRCPHVAAAHVLGAASPQAHQRSHRRPRAHLHGFRTPESGSTREVARCH